MILYSHRLQQNSFVESITGLPHAGQELWGSAIASTAEAEEADQDQHWVSATNSGPRAST